IFPGRTPLRSRPRTRRVSYGHPKLLAMNFLKGGNALAESLRPAHSDLPVPKDQLACHPRRAGLAQTNRAGVKLADKLVCPWGDRYHPYEQRPPRFPDPDDARPRLIRGLRPG